MPFMRFSFDEVKLALCYNLHTMSGACICLTAHHNAMPVAMLPLGKWILSQRRTKIRACEHPWDDKCCNNRVLTISLRCQAAKKQLLENPLNEEPHEVMCPVVNPHEVLTTLNANED